MGQTQRKLPVVGQKDQPFTVAIQTAHRIEVLPLFGQKFPDCLPPLWIATGAEIAGRFVQSHIEPAPGTNRLSVDGHSVRAGIYLGAQLPDDLAIDRDAPGENKFLGGTPRGYARIGQKFLQTDHLRTECAECGTSSESAEAIPPADSAFRR
jgi:hypothetical protein